MEARNYAPNATHNMILPADAQIVSGVLGNAVYLPIGCGTLEMSGALDALGVSMWRTWDGVSEADGVRGIFSFKNFASYFDNVTGKLCVILPGGTVVQTDVDDDTELTHWVFNFIKNGTISIYKNAVKVYEAQSAEDAVDLTDGFTLGGGKTHATFDEVYVHTELLKDEEINGLFYLIRSGMPQQQIQEIAQSGAAKYLGVTETVPDNRGVLIVRGEQLGTVYANTGDWVLMSKTVGGWKTGICYRWSGIMWINLEPEYNYEAQYQACLAHICEIPELTQNTAHYGALFAKLIAAQEAFIEKLVTSEAFINKLATNEAFIDKLITKRLKVDSDTASNEDFEVDINETIGVIAKKENNMLFEIRPDGQINLGNALYSSGKFKAENQTRSFVNEDKLEDFISFVDFALKNGFENTGLVNGISFNEIKVITQKTLISDYTIQSRREIGGQFGRYTYECIDWSVKEYQITNSLSFFHNGTQVFAKVYSGETKEVLQISEKYNIEGGYLAYVPYPTGYVFSPLLDFESTVTSTQMAITIKLFNVPLSVGQSFEPGTIFRDDTGTLHIAF